nr:MAG TPA: hypothetical protein [Caudoviricetes sp.]
MIAESTASGVRGGRFKLFKRFSILRGNNQIKPMKSVQKVIKKRQPRKITPTRKGKDSEF